MPPLDDPPDPADLENVALLASARGVPAEVMALPPAPAERANRAYDAFVTRVERDGLDEARETDALCVALVEADA